MLSGPAGDNARCRRYSVGDTLPHPIPSGTSWSVAIPIVVMGIYAGPRPRFRNWVLQ